MKFLTSIIIVLCSQAFTIAQPKVALSGPSQKEVGRLAIIKTTMSPAGADIKFDCAPKNEDWQVVRFQNGELGVIFSTDKAGTYHFFIAASDDKGKIATSVHEIVIGHAAPAPAPKVTPKETTLDEVIDKAYKDDISNKAGTIEHKKTLATIYKTAAKTVFNKDLTKVSQIYDSMRMSAESFLPKTTLANVRNVIAKFQQENLKVQADTPLTDELRNTLSEVFFAIATALEKAE